MFGNLQAHKRNPDNPAYQTRRTSVEEQAAEKPGILASAFNK